MTTRLLVRANSNWADLVLQTCWRWRAEYQNGQEGKCMCWLKVAKVGSARPDACQMWMQRMGLDGCRVWLWPNPEEKSGEEKKIRTAKSGISVMLDVAVGADGWSAGIYTTRQPTSKFRENGAKQNKKKMQTTLVCKVFSGRTPQPRHIDGAGRTPPARLNSYIVSKVWTASATGCTFILHRQPIIPFLQQGRWLAIN